MATEGRDDELDAEGPPTQPSAPSAHAVVDRALADMVVHLQSLIDELREVRAELKRDGVTPRLRGRLGGAFRRLRSQATFTADAIDPPRRPQARTYGRKRA